MELVLDPSSAAAAEPPTRPRLSRPLLFVVEVEVEPAELVWRDRRAESTGLPTGAAMATATIKLKRMVKRML